jgi:hypothetical protein
MQKRSACAPNPKKHEKYIEFKKNTEQLMRGKDYISASCDLLAIFLYCLPPDMMQFQLHDFALLQYHINLILMEVFLVKSEI